jgi:hypothetical protein
MDKLLTFGALKADSRYYSLDSVSGYKTNTAEPSTVPVIPETPTTPTTPATNPVVIPETPTTPDNIPAVPAPSTPEINLGKITEEKPQPESNLEENQVAAKLAEYFSKNPDELQSIIEKAKKG